MRKFIFSFLALILVPIYAMGQEIKGKVTDVKGIGIPAAYVVAKASNKSTITDVDGNFKIKASVGETITVSMLGYETVNAKASSETMRFTLKDSKEDLKEVVVIGYGTAKKRDLTGSVATIKGTELTKTPSGQIGQAVQGKIAGVQVISNGSPGDTPIINIRGVRSLYGDNQPLYVVDGILVDNIDFLGSNDIKDITILKDASSAAIYGYKAANGVFIVTTKGGGYNKPAKLSYETYFGVQQASNVVKMANAEQFTNFALESGSASEIGSINAAIQRFGRSRVNPNLPNVNTDWYKETLRLATMSNHSLSVDGGSEKVSYSLGGDFFSQDGILKMKNSYKRFNIRGSIDAKAKDWLTVGAKFVYSRSTKYDDEASAWSQIYYAVPILPVYDNLFTDASPHPYSDARVLGYRDSQNPFPLLDNSDRLGVRKRNTINIYANFNIIPKELSFKTSLSYNNREDNQRTVSLPYFVTNSYQRDISESSIERKSITYENYTWDNVLTYTKKLGDHDLTLLGGTAFNDDSYKWFSVRGFFDPGSGFSRNIPQTWYLENTTASGRLSDDYEDSNKPSVFYALSYFARFQYIYKNKYILYVTDRREGANKYQDKYINLPAFGASWVVSEESFLKDNNSINLLKLRAGWGRLANGNVPANRIKSALNRTTIFNDQVLNGFGFATYDDNLSWEFTEETNLGLSSELFNNRLTIEADYFIKDTKNLAIPVSPIIGSELSYKNVGNLRNKGFELSLGWKDKIGENFGYNINGNFSKIKNEVTNIGGQDFINRGSAEFQQRLVVGQPLDVFYGWDIVGVYQNQAEIDADPVAVNAGNIKPGYFRYRDIDGNNILDANDRTYIGSPLPTYFYGGSLGLNYKNWDLSLAFYGQGGNVILNRNRAEVIRTSGRNIDAEFAINRWHGEGTTNEFPSSEGYRQSWNQRNSKFWLEKGDFLRVQNIQLGYNLKSDKLPETRFTLTADRPYLWSKSKILFNPEVGNSGVDLGVYPTPSIVSLGCSIKL